MLVVARLGSPTALAFAGSCAVDGATDWAGLIVLTLRLSDRRFQSERR
jgi:hypothetical protein